MGNEPSWLETNSFLPPKKSHESRNALNDAQPPCLLIRSTVYWSASTTLGSLRRTFFPSLETRSTPLACAHIGRNSGIFGSKPIRLTLPPDCLAIAVAAAVRALQSLVLTPLRAASLTAVLFVISTRTLLNSGTPYVLPLSLTWSTAVGRNWSILMPDFLTQESSGWIAPRLA